jgi:uncharacterized membrane protein YeaQ/YmgE (transglycosylase-associated protein family)
MFEIMGLGSWVLMGLIAGAIARFLLPGKGSAGCLSTILIGVAGALLGGFLATSLDFGGISGFDPRSLIVATLGAVVLLIAIRIVRGPSD